MIHVYASDTMAVGSGLFSRQDGEDFKCCANSAVHLKLVRKKEDVIDAEKSFHPEMSHQIFGDSETIFGYKGLEVQLYYHAGSLLTYLGMKYEKEIPTSAGMEVDSVLDNIAEVIPNGYCTNLDEFVARMKEEDKFKPAGELMHAYRREDCTYEVYRGNFCTPKLKDYHDRLQTFVLWYIDAASFIDSDDEKWDIFLLFEKRKEEGNDVYSIVGYSTVYNYYAYPANKRPRISQMLILPPFQRKGHGGELLQSIYNYYSSLQSVKDITVEGPSPEFTKLRDIIDCRNCMRLPAFHPDRIRQGFSKQMEREALEKLKLTKLQCRRVYEILRLRATNTADATDYREYRLEIKKRLNAPFEKQDRDLEKVRRYIGEDEMEAMIINVSKDERMQRLEESFRFLEQEYRAVIDRLGA